MKSIVRNLITLGLRVLVLAAHIFLPPFLFLFLFFFHFFFFFYFLFFLSLFRSDCKKSHYTWTSCACLSCSYFSTSLPILIPLLLPFLLFLLLLIFPVLVLLSSFTFSSFFFYFLFFHFQLLYVCTGFKKCFCSASSKLHRRQIFKAHHHKIAILIVRDFQR